MGRRPSDAGNLMLRKQLVHIELSLRLLTKIGPKLPQIPQEYKRSEHLMELMSCLKTKIRLAQCLVKYDKRLSSITNIVLSRDTVVIYKRVSPKTRKCPFAR